MIKKFDESMIRLLSTKSLFIFDRDDTLLDERQTMGVAMCKAAIEVFQDVNQQKAIAKTLGLDLESQLLTEDSMVRTATREQIIEALVKEFSDHFDALFTSFLANFVSVPFEHAQPVLELLKRKGIACAMASNDGYDNVVSSVEQLGWLQFFLTVLGVDDEKGLKSKPDGSMLKATIELAGVVPSEVVMVGNEVNDLLAARDAGVFYIQIGPLRENPRGFRPNLHFESLSAFYAAIDAADQAMSQASSEGITVFPIQTPRPGTKLTP